MGKPRSLIDIDEVQLYLDNGWSQKDIASEVGVSKQTLQNFLNENRLSKKLRTNQISGKSNLQIQSYINWVEIITCLFQIRTWTRSLEK